MNCHHCIEPLKKFQKEFSGTHKKLVYQKEEHQQSWPVWISTCATKSI